MGHRCDRALDAILDVRALGAICVKYDSPLSLLAFVLLTSATLRDAKDRMRRKWAFGLWHAGGEPREGGRSMETYAGNASPVAPAANLCVNLPRRTSVWNLTDSMCNCDGAIKEGVPALRHGPRARRGGDDEEGEGSAYVIGAEDGAP
ncbi:hypothetical protein C8R45DRAFT_1091205 [Mycena sanguinolenta]|nr:hypothetical protein C8R45DRAFT_1091205 [Mycena sanguinolenta]